MKNRYYLPLQCGEAYHVFSRAIGDERVFREDENYAYFLDRLRHHLSPVVRILAYSLIPNHFHLLVRIRDEDEVVAHFERIKKKAFEVEQHDLSDFIMERFSNWLNGYVKAFNKRYQRKGGLFMDYLRRNEAQDQEALLNFLLYIHGNAVHHGLELHIGNWPFDSYQMLLSSKYTWLEREEVMGWFSSSEAFRQFHQRVNL